MQALKDIPKVLGGIQDLRKFSNPEQLLAEYKNNFKLFVQALTNEVLVMIQNYQTKIQQLVSQNQRLKQNQPFVEAFSPIKKLNGSPRKVPSPPNQYKCIDMMQTAKSKVFGVSQLHNLEKGAMFSTVLSKYKKSDDEDNQFPIELINGNHGESGELQRKSRFITKSNIKKQKEEELRHYLQARSKNLEKTTRQLLKVIGKDSKEEESSQLHKNDQLNNQKSDSSLQNKNESNLNKSLGKICQSMDTSFHSRKARSKNAKKREQVQDEIKKKQKQDEEVAKMLKDRGVKNLLHRLRENVQNSKNPPQIIKGSKLISCGKGAESKKKESRQNEESPSFSNRKNSKVMINPIPVDIVQKSKATRKDSVSPGSPQKKPQSILKNSTVLSRSLSGISAIQFV